MWSHCCVNDNRCSRSEQLVAAHSPHILCSSLWTDPTLHDGSDKGLEYVDVALQEGPDVFGLLCHIVSFCLWLFQDTWRLLPPYLVFVDGVIYDNFHFTYVGDFDDLAIFWIKLLQQVRFPCLQPVCVFMR